MRRTDPLILGGGPAGAAAAIHLLRAGARPVLVERQRETGDALCGGFLSWATLRQLEALGIGAEQLGGARVTRLALFMRGRVHEVPLPGLAMGVSRRRLDGLILAEAERLGAEIRRGVGVRAVEGRRLLLEDGGAMAAECLFLASGKHEVRGLARPRTGSGADAELGLRMRLPASGARGRLVGGRIELHLFAGGYMGMVLQEDGSLNACMAVRKSRLGAAGGSPVSLFAALAEESPALAERLGDRRDWPRIEAVGHVPYGWRAAATAPGIFRLGDQAGVISSLAGEGIGIALASARGAVSAWREGGGEAAPDWQRHFARTMARPLHMAEMVKAAAARPWLSGMAGALMARVPAIAALIAAATRMPVDPTS